MEEPRYQMICVAPEVPGWSTDYLDAALLSTCSWYGSHFDIYDRQEGCYVEGIRCQEDEDELRARIAQRAIKTEDTKEDHGYTP